MPKDPLKGIDLNTPLLIAKNLLKCIYGHACAVQHEVFMVVLDDMSVSFR